MDVEIPEDDRTPDGHLPSRTQFVHDFGAMLTLWAEFELSIEIKIAQLAGMSPPKASIVLCSINFGAKINILCSLLELEGKADVIKAVRAVVQAARRNALIHAIPAMDESQPGRFAFVRREIQQSYRVQNIEFTAEEFHKHYREFRVTLRDACLAMGFRDGYLEEYGRAAGFEWPS